VVSAAPAGGLALDRVRAAAAALTGEIQQVPPAVSAIKVGGRRAYQLAREGAAPVLEARAVTVDEFTITDPRPAGPDGRLLDVTAAVRCSSGTYVRALARDLGSSLGVGGHLTMLRRTRVGPYRLDAARGLAELAEQFQVIPLAEAAAAAFPVRPLTEAEAQSLSHGASPGRAGRGAGRPGQAAGRVRALRQRMLPSRAAWQAWVAGERRAGRHHGHRLAYLTREAWCTCGRAWRTCQRTGAGPW